MDKRLEYTYNLACLYFPQTRGRVNAPFPVVSNIWMGNELISTGYARPKTHPIMKQFGHKPEQVFLHAEMEALVKASRELTVKELRSCTITVARAMKDSPTGFLKPANACPCKGCHKALVKFGISNEEVLHT